jgi:hypothetical protein
VEGAVDGDQPQHVLVSERPAAKGRLDLMTFRGMIHSSVSGSRDRQPGVATQAAVPPEAVHHPGEVLVLRSYLRRLGADKEMPVPSALEQLVRELAP